MSSPSTAPDSGSSARTSARRESVLARWLAWWSEVPAPEGPLRPLLSHRTCAVLVGALLVLGGLLFCGGLGIMAAAVPAGLAAVLLMLNYPWTAFFAFMLSVGLNWTIASWPTSPTKAGAGLVVGMTVVNLLVRGLRPRLHWMHLWLMAFAVWSLVSANVVGNAESSQGFSFTMVGWVLVLVAAYQLFQGPTGMTAVFGCYAVSAAAGCMVTIFSYGSTGFSTLVPVAGDPNDFGMLAASGAVVGIGLARERAHWLVRTFWVLCLLTCLTVTIGSLSRGSIMGLGAAVVVHFCTQPRDRKAILAALVVLGLVMAAVYPFIADQVQVALQQKEFVAQGNVSSRFDAWAIALGQLAQHPVTGIGIGALQPHYMQQLFLPPGALALAYSHNTYIEILYGTGLVGAAIMFTAVGWALWTGWRAQRVDPEAQQHLPPEQRVRSVGGMRGVVLPAVVTVFVACLTVTEIMYPPYWMAFVLAFAGALTAGQAPRGRQPAYLGTHRRGPHPSGSGSASRTGQASLQRSEAE